MANAVHQRHLAHRGGDDGRVRQRRDLVTEERAGADRTRGRGQRHTETLCSAHYVSLREAVDYFLEGRLRPEAQPAFLAGNARRILELERV